MNQKLLSSLTATLFMTTVGIPLPSNASSAEVADPGSEVNLKTAYNQISTPAVDLSSEVVKLGEQQSQTTTASPSPAVARIHSHELAGRKAVTLYVRNIPVLTFLDSNNPGSDKTAAPEDVKVGTQVSESAGAVALNKALDNSSPSQSAPDYPSDALPTGTKASSSDLSQDDPVWRAAQIAAKLNQLSQDGIDANTITVRWNPQASGSGRYEIKANTELLAVVDSRTILPDTTRNLERDALQAANRLRRLLGNAKPLSGVEGSPRRTQSISLGSFRIPLNGFASWYGPGFHGNMSASGERFNQHALTAAHRTLPFGTQVRVTNMDNGVSVVVRINDRGPFHGNRIIDLSAGAARIIGLVQSGVAPVRLDVLVPETIASDR